jgi:LAO/AO transport system kinase
MSNLVADYAEPLVAGNRRALARAITLVEIGGPPAWELLGKLHANTGRAQIVGVTGAPGSGKSTLVNALASQWREQQRTVGIIAVDPSSPFSGGAILGDRIRMQPLGGDSGVFVRSMANRGRLGGLARATSDAAALLDAAGFDIVIIETVGAGQSEVEIASAAHTTVVIEVPGMGDEVQSIKAGILEIADLFVVNKADHAGAQTTIRQLQAMLQLEKPAPGDWVVPVLPAVAVQNDGIAAVATAINDHFAFLRTADRLVQREQKRVEREFTLLLGELALARVRQQLDQAGWQTLIAQLANRSRDPYQSANELLDRTVQLD